MYSVKVYQWRALKDTVRSKRLEWRTATRCSGTECISLLLAQVVPFGGIERLRACLGSSHVTVNRDEHDSRTRMAGKVCRWADGCCPCCTSDVSHFNLLRGASLKSRRVAQAQSRRETKTTPSHVQMTRASVGNNLRRLHLSHLRFALRTDKR